MAVIQFTWLVSSPSVLFLRLFQKRNFGRYVACVFILAVTRLVASSHWRKHEELTPTSGLACGFILSLSTVRLLRKRALLLLCWLCDVSARWLTCGHDEFIVVCLLPRVWLCMCVSVRLLLHPWTVWQNGWICLSDFFSLPSTPSFCFYRKEHLGKIPMRTSLLGMSNTGWVGKICDLKRNDVSDLT